MEIFWLDEPEILIKEYREVLPTKSQSIQQQLNALTRLILLITLVLLIIQFDLWYLFLLFSIIIVVIMAIIIIDDNDYYSENYSKQDKMKSSSNKMNKNPKKMEHSSQYTSPVLIYDEAIDDNPVYVDSLRTHSPRVRTQSEYNLTPKQCINPKAKCGNDASFSSPRHNGSVGYLSADNSDISSSGNLDTSKEKAIEHHYMRENIRREKMMQGYSRKRENDNRHHLEAGGYAPPYSQNQHYFRQDEPQKRSYNGYAIL